MKSLFAAAGLVLAFLLSPLALRSQPAVNPSQGVVSDWSHHHILYPASGNLAITTRIANDPRWRNSWYLRHRQARWREWRRGGAGGQGSGRDWSEPLGSTTFQPIFDYIFDIAPETGYGSLNTLDQLNGVYLATAGSLTVTGGNDLGTYSLYPSTGGSPYSALSLGSVTFEYDDLITAYLPSTSPPLDYWGWLFTASSVGVNIWYNTPGEPNAGDYSFYDQTNTGVDNAAGTVDVYIDPGGGQTYPAKYVFDVTAPLTPANCTNDFVAIGIPATPASGGQANIIGFNNLYTSPSGGFCNTATIKAPTVLFAYASGSGEVPGNVSISMNGAEIAYVENLLTDSSYFHVLTIGTTGTNGASATAAAIPGTSGGNNAVDQRLLLSPDGGTTNQSSTSSPFIDYTSNAAYVTTYSWASGGSGYLYKIGNVFNGGTPVIAWVVPISAVPSSPVYDTMSNKVFFTDSNGRIDYVVDSGSSPSVTYGAVLAPGATSLNPVIVDSVHEMVYATFNTNGANALVVQAPTTMASSVSVSVGTGSTTYTGPYGVDFNNAWYTGSGTPLLFVAGTGSGTVPTLYSVGFNGSGVLNSTANNNPTPAALATGMADASPVTEFYNTTTSTDYLFVGVTDNCRATTNGGTAGCVMSLNITGGYPTVSASTAAIPALGGSSGIIVDNDSSDAQASSCYFATKNGVTPGTGVGSGASTLAKATQSALE